MAPPDSELYGFSFGPDPTEDDTRQRVSAAFTTIFWMSAA